MPPQPESTLASAQALAARTAAERTLRWCRWGRGPTEQRDRAMGGRGIAHNPRGAKPSEKEGLMRLTFTSLEDARIVGEWTLRPNPSSGKNVTCSAFPSCS